MIWFFIYDSWYDWIDNANEIGEWYDMTRYDMMQIIFDIFEYDNDSFIDLIYDLIYDNDKL